MNIYKYNLVKNAGEVVNRPGYINIKPDDDWSLDFCDASTTDEIDASKVLEYVDTNHVDELIDHWTDKLIQGGSLILGSTDVYSVAESLSTGKIDEKMFNILVHGDGKKINYSSAQLSDVLSARGYVIDNIHYTNQFDYKMKAIKR